MKSSRSPKFHLASYAKDDGTRSIELRLGMARINTGICCKLDNWNQKEQVVLSSDKQYRKKNNTLFNIMEKISGLTAVPISDEQFKIEATRILFGEEVVIRHTSFLHYWDEFVATKSSPGTLRTYNNARKKLEAFDPDARFDTMNKGWLLRFEGSLRKEECCTNYISIIMRCVRAVFNYCIDCEYTNLYPFRRYTIKQQETKKRSLTVEQLRTLRDYKVEEHQEKYRDCFMLCLFLIGINLTDLFSLTPKSYKHGYIVYNRAKTGRPYEIKVEPEAEEIITRYHGSDHLLCWADEWNMDNFKSRMNKELKKIGSYERKGRGGKKIFDPLFPDLSSYWSRHTWATLAAELDIPIETIGHALGHSDEAHSVTNIYIRFDNNKIDAANRQVLDYLAGKKD